MEPYIKDDKLYIPQRAEGPDGLVGDGWREMKPDEPGYQETLEYATFEAKIRAEVEKRFPPGG
jgi:hypothetical protein